MTNYQPGDVVLVTYPFAEGGPGKRRPALVLLDTGDTDVLLARITTQLYNTSFDVSFGDSPGAGLLAPSVVRLHKMATVKKTLIQRKLGALTQLDQQQVAKVLPGLWRLW